VDRFDNRVAIASQATVKDDRGNSWKAPMAGGRATVPLTGLKAAGPFRVSASMPELRQSRASNPCLPPIDGLSLLFGDLHAHDFLSEAFGRTEDVYRWARDDKRLDFLSVPVQSHGYQDNEKWTLARYMNEAFLDEGRFVTFLGFEWQHSHFGDKVVHFLSGDQPYLPVDDGRYDHPLKLYEALRPSDAIAISHRPGYPPDRHVPGTCFDVVETDIERAVENLVHARLQRGL
jgi:hypothetical protein